MGELLNSSVTNVFCGHNEDKASDGAYVACM